MGLNIKTSTQNNGSTVHQKNSTVIGRMRFMKGILNLYVAIPAEEEISTNPPDTNRGRLNHIDFL